MGRMISKNWLRLLLIFLTAFGITLIGGVAVKSLLHYNSTNQNETPAEDPPTSSNDGIPEETIITPDFIDLQPTVDNWLATAPGNVGLMIYDLDNNQVAAASNADRVFNTASVYKLFFAYDGYREIDAGRDDGTAVLVVTPDKGELSVSACLDLIIRESYNGCADPLRADPERYARAEALVTDLGLTHTSSAGLYSSAADLTELMKLYWQHPDLSAESWAAIQDSMLNQPATTYNWRQGLPSGFRTAEVYDKVGWNYTGSYWSIYNDVAFLVFPEQNRHYIMVVLTENFPTYTSITNLGTMIETIILANNTTDNSATEGDTPTSNLE